MGMELHVVLLVSPLILCAESLDYGGKRRSSIETSRTETRVTTSITTRNAQSQKYTTWRRPEHLQCMTHNRQRSDSIETHGRTPEKNSPLLDKKTNSVNEKEDETASKYTSTTTQSIQTKKSEDAPKKYAFTNQHEKPENKLSDSFKQVLGFWRKKGEDS